MVRHLIGGAAILALAAMGAAIWWLSGNSGMPQAAAQTAGQAIPVTAGTVATEDVPVFLHGIGTVQAYNTVAVKSRVDGQIIKINFKEGQDVKVGDPLFQIDPRPYQSALEMAQAAKEKDEAQLAGAKLDLDRYEKLLAPGWQTKQSYDQQKATVEQFQAAIKGDIAQIENAKLNLGYADIRSPIDGRLGARLVDTGNLVHASDNTPLVMITELKPIFVSFTLPQETLDDVHEQNKQAPLVVRAYSGDDKKQLAEGKLTLIDNMIDQATGTIHLKARFDNDDERLWPGEFVNLRLILSTRKGVATVPQQTVQVGPNGYYAYVIKPDNTVERRAVEVASMQDGLAVITKGLTVGENVVVDGQYRLTEGARVNPTTAGQPGAAG
ncbi:MAG: efflux RND transporter periplasmic adaptor subunit [Alphaproteobacteria bacterium]|nr:efflux RND transporter periplasmic adaptor subunit [Alphaproteobacteria bacterium]